MWVIRDIPSYRVYDANGHNCKGIVTNMLTGERRLFPSRTSAESYSKLSGFNKPEIEAVDTVPAAPRRP